MIRSLLRWRSPAGTGARLSILIFHRVLREIDPIFPGELDARRFDAVCSWLVSWFNVLPLAQAIDRLGQGSLPERAACITFDDGYADNHDLALPILERHGLNATFFVASAYLGGGRMFNDSVIESVRRAPGPELDLSTLGLAGLGRFDLRTPASRAACIEQVLGAVKYLQPEARLDAVQRVTAACGSPKLPDDLMMTAEQVRALHLAGMGIGAHTHSHPILARLGDAEALAEMRQGRDELQSIIGAPVMLFAYPNGKPRQDYSAASVRLAREAGFDAAMSTAWGAAGAGADRYQLPRHTPWDRSRARFGLRMVRNLRHPIDTLAA